MFFSSEDYLTAEKMNKVALSQFASTGLLVLIE